MMKPWPSCTISVRREFFQTNGVDQADVRCQPLSGRGHRQTSAPSFESSAVR
jgi:hypothetical protein